MEELSSILRSCELQVRQHVDDSEQENDAIFEVAIDLCMAYLILALQSNECLTAKTLTYLSNSALALDTPPPYCIKGKFTALILHLDPECNFYNNFKKSREDLIDAMRSK